MLSMDEHGDVVTVPRVSESTVSGSVRAADENLIESLGCGGQNDGSFVGEEDGGEIMVEVVGSDVFVDGVGGGRICENGGDEREMGTAEGEGDLGSRELVCRAWDAGKDTGVEGFQEIAGSSGETVFDVVTEKVEMMVNGDVVTEDGEGLERRDEFTEGGDVSCVLTTSAHDASVNEVGEGGSLVATGSSIGETQVIAEKVAVFVTEEGVERTVESFDEVGGNHLTSQIGVLGDEACNPGIEAEVVSSSLIAHPPTAQTQIVLEQVSIVVKQEGLNCKDDVLHSNVVDAKSPCLEKDQSASVGMVYVETDAGVTGANAEFRDQQAEPVKGEDEVENKEESLHLKFEVNKSVVLAGNLQCSVKDGQMKIKMVGESTPNRYNVGVDSISFSEQAKIVACCRVANVEDNVSSVMSTETSKVGCLRGTEDSITCPDLVSSIEHTQVVAGSSEDIDMKVVDSEKAVHVSGKEEVLPTESRSVFNANTNCVVEDEPKVETLCESSKTDDAICADPESFSKQIEAVNDGIATDGMIANPLAEVSTSENAKCKTTCADVVKEVEQICISEREVSRMDIEEATDLEDNGSGSDSLDDSLSCSVRAQYLKVEQEIVNNNSKSDVAICGEPECLSGQIPNDGIDEAKVMRSNALTSKLEVPRTVIDGISGCSEDLQSMKCEPACDNAGEGGAVPSDAENSNEQALVSEIGEAEAMDVEALTSEFDAYSNDLSFPWEDQHTKAVGSSGNDVARGQEDMETPLEGIVVSRAETIMGTATLEEKKYVEQNSDDNVMCNDISLIAEAETKGRHVSEGVTSNEVVDLVFEVKDEPCSMDDKCIVFADIHQAKDSEKSDNESVMGSLVESIGTFPVDEGKKSKGEHLEENVTLPYNFNCIDADVQGIGGDVDLQFSECFDESATGNCAGVSLDLDCRLGVKLQYNDEEQVDLHREQDAEVQDPTLGIEKLAVLNKKIPEQMSPDPGSGVTECHSCYLLPPKNEGEFSVSDLVWGKVRSHPWWPGQIFDPADASEKAVKYHKKDCFLVAYFGDRTFAWNDASLLRPFRAHFSQIEKQSNSEAFQHAVNSALAEVSRRVELGLACSCIPKVALVEIESQIVENTGIHQKASRRYGVDESTGVSCFEPEKLVDNIRSLALLPSDGVDQLEFVIAKAHLSAFSRFKGYRPLPEFQLCGGLLEKDVSTSELSDMIEKQIKGENNSSNKRKHDLSDSLHPSKKERSMTELMGDLPHSSDDEDEPDGNVVDKSVTSAGRKRKPLDYVTDGSDKRISFYAAKVSTTASPITKPSFKVGECIRRVASQLTGSPSLLKCNSEKFLKVDDSVDQQVGLDVSLQTPVYSQRRRILSPEHSSLDELLPQLHLAARDPMKGYSFLTTTTSFFTDFRHSIALSQNSRRRNPSTCRGGRKKKAPNVIANSPEDFEFDDVNDSYWTDRIVHNYAEEQLLHNAQNGEVEYQLVNYEPVKPLKSGRRSRKRFYSGDHEPEAEEPAEHTCGQRQDCSPTELILNFTVGNSVPSELNLNKIFRRFGPLRESETEVDTQTSRARVVFKKCSDAEVALSSSRKFNIFGPMPVNYELSYVPSAPFKTLPPTTLEAQEDAT